MTALAVELSASRLLGNVYGSSNLVWASIIGLILIYLTVGYWLGGRLADRSPSHEVFYRIILWGSFSVGLVPMVARPFLRVTANAFDRLELPILVGAFITVLVLFIIPVTLIGMVSPFALKLSRPDASNVGKMAGRLSAISTLGAFIGTFLPVLILVPLIGTYRTFLFFSSLLMVIAIIGYWMFVNFRKLLKFCWMPLILLSLWIFGARGPDKATQNLIYEDESAYNYIQVVEINQFRYLRLNEGQGMHSVYHPTQVNYYGPWEQVLAAPFFNSAPHDLQSVQRIALVGLAAGTSARQANIVYGQDIHIDGYEIDPKIIDVAKDLFEMNQINLDVHIQDGRWGLAHSDGEYDIISIDAYRPPYIPWQMTTVEFFEIVNQKLSSDGVMVINIGRSPLDRTLVNDLGTTITQVFPTIFVMDIPDSFNSMIFASKQPGSWDNFIENFSIIRSSEIDPLLLNTMALTISNRQPDPEMTMVYTDDRAPIELLTNKIVVDYFFAGGLDELQ